MNISVYLPFLASLAIGLTGGLVARRARPAVGAVGLSAVALVAGAGSLWALTLLTATLVDDVKAIDPHAVKLPVPDAIGTVAALCIAVAAARIAAVLLRRRRVHHRVRDALVDLPPPDSDVRVLADARPDAFAVPGRRYALARRYRSQIVVTEGMLAALDPDQRRALLAHERAHLDGGHHRLRAAVELAAAANPLLIPARRTVGYLCERWADESAVAEVGSRKLVADAIATAALACAADTRSYAAEGAADGLNADGADRLGFNQLGTVERVVALHAPAPSALRVFVLGAAAAALAILVADANATTELVEVLRTFL
jgi:hypothetical protein